MSALIGRFVIAVGIGLVTAVVYTLIKERREQHSHHGHGRGSRRTQNEDDSDYRSRPSWGSRPDDDDDDDCNTTGHRTSYLSSYERNKKEDKTRSEPTSVLASCPICYESFQDLKRKGIAIFTTPCGHLFCKKCLTQAVVTNQRCPSCNIQVPFSKCHRIYL